MATSQRGSVASATRPYNDTAGTDSHRQRASASSPSSMDLLPTSLPSHGSAPVYKGPPPQPPPSQKRAPSPARSDRTGTPPSSPRSVPVSPSGVHSSSSNNNNSSIRSVRAPRSRAPPQAYVSPPEAVRVKEAPNRSRSSPAASTSSYSAGGGGGGGGGRVAPPRSSPRSSPRAGGAPRSPSAYKAPPSSGAASSHHHPGSRGSSPASFRLVRTPSSGRLLAEHPRALEHILHSVYGMGAESVATLTAGANLAPASWRMVYAAAGDSMTPQAVASAAGRLAPLLVVLRTDEGEVLGGVHAGAPALGSSVGAPHASSFLFKMDFGRTKLYRKRRADEPGGGSHPCAAGPLRFGESDLVVDVARGVVSSRMALHHDTGRQGESLLLRGPDTWAGVRHLHVFWGVRADDVALLALAACAAAREAARGAAGRDAQLEELRLRRLARRAADGDGGDVAVDDGGAAPRHSPDSSPTSVRRPAGAGAPAYDSSSSSHWFSGSRRAPPATADVATATVSDAAVNTTDEDGGEHRGEEEAPYRGRSTSYEPSFREPSAATTYGGNDGSGNGAPTFHYHPRYALRGARRRSAYETSEPSVRRGVRATAAPSGPERLRAVTKGPTPRRGRSLPSSSRGGGGGGGGGFRTKGIEGFMGLKGTSWTPYEEQEWERSLCDGRGFRSPLPAKKGGAASGGRRRGASTAASAASTSRQREKPLWREKLEDVVGASPYCQCPITGLTYEDDRNFEARRAEVDGVMRNVGCPERLLLYNYYREKDGGLWRDLSAEVCSQKWLAKVLRWARGKGGDAFKEEVESLWRDALDSHVMWVGHVLQPEDHAPNEDETDADVFTHHFARHHPARDEASVSMHRSCAAGCVKMTSPPRLARAQSSSTSPRYTYNPADHSVRELPPQGSPRREPSPLRRSHSTSPGYTYNPTDNVAYAG